MDEQYTESRLREELRHAVDHVQVPSDMWARIRHRHRREPRQRMLAVATSMALLAIVVAAAFPLVRDAAQQRDPVGKPIPSETPTPDRNPLAPITAEPAGSARILTQSEIDGHPWRFTAFETTDGRLAWGFPQPDRDTIGGGWTSGSSNPLRDTPLTPSVQIRIGTTEGMPSFVYGPVVKDAAVVRVQTPDGEIREVPVVGQDAGFAVNFYAAPIPTGVSVDGVRVTAHDANGRQVGSAWSGYTQRPSGNEHDPVPTTELPPGMPAAPPESWDPRPLGPGEHTPTGSPTTLARGGPTIARDWTRGEDWTLVVYPMGDGVCYGFLLGADLTPGQGWCTSTAGRGDLGYSPQHLNPSGGSAGMLLGLVDKDATGVRLAYPSGRTVELSSFDKTLIVREGLPVGFYADIIPEGEPATSVDRIDVRSYGRAGREFGGDTG